MKYIIRTRNQTVKFSKFTLNITYLKCLKGFSPNKLCSRQSEQIWNTWWLFVFWPFWVFLALITSFNTSLNNTFYITYFILLSLYLNIISLFLLILILFFLFCSKRHRREKKFKLKKIPNINSTSYCTLL